MSYSHYDRLTAIDASMLAVEDANTHMHVGAVALFDAAPLTTAEGELDIERIRDGVSAALRETPRFRQKLTYIPLLNHPVWVDDPRFNIDYHVRHTALPTPGRTRVLKRLTGRLMSQKLDLDKPLWELWVIEGVEEGRFALIVKAHHCMVDGISGMDLLTGLMSPDPDATLAAEEAWIPRAAPGGASLLKDELGRRATIPFSLAAAGWRAATEPLETLKGIRNGVAALRDSLQAGGGSVSQTPLDDETGPYRRVDWVRVDLDAALEAKKILGGTLNDLILACAAGAFGHFLKQRGLRIEDLDFRASIPVNIRAKEGDDDLGNRISSLFAPLPISEPDPRKRLARVIETTRELKSSGDMGGWGTLSELSDRAFPSLMGSFIKLMSTRLRLINVYVSNIPGPRVPVYLAGARMLELYPVAPVVHVLGVALFSYDGGLYWCFNADWDKFPDLHDLVERTQEEFELLCKAVAEGPLPVADPEEEA